MQACLKVFSRGIEDSFKSTCLGEYSMATYMLLKDQTMVLYDTADDTRLFS